jgi:hypothetical protein
MLHRVDTHISPPEGGTVFFTLVGTERQAQHARLLVESLRAFGGRLGDCAVWVLYHDQAGLDPDFLAGACRDLEGVHLVPLAMEDGFRYWFSAKVQACAQAEEMAGSRVRSLVWVGPECLIVRPPLLFDLTAPAGASSVAAFRTVHHVNVGSLAREPLDPFWSAVYRLVGLDEAPFTIESFVDMREIRPYWNTHCFSVDPACGLLQAWREGFRDMVADEAFQAGPCRDELHRIFLHQAVLSALVARRVDRERIRALPPEYSYPLHMHDQVPAARRAQALNDLVCAVYEEDLPLDGIRVQEPLRSWLGERAPAVD